MTSLLQRIPSTPGLLSPKPQKQLKISDLLIRRICDAYSAEDARREGIYYWPDPLPTPAPRHLPDPLVLFPTPDLSDATGDRLSLVPLSIQEVVARRSKAFMKPSLQIPLGLIDMPEQQQRTTLLLDLHAPSATLSGGPLLILGSPNSGKGTALQTLLLWLTARYLPSQFRCAVIDPTHDLDAFQSLPHLHDARGHSLWTAGASDEAILQVANRCQALFSQRRALYPHLRWNDETLTRSWSQGVEMPLVLLIVSNYHRFVDRPRAARALKDLALTIADSQALGAYSVITSAEVGSRHLPTDLLNKVSTRICLFINEHQQTELFGQPCPMDPIPGRGLLLTPDRQQHQVQLALPTRGASETERAEKLSSSIACCSTS